MEYSTLISETVLGLEDDVFESLKKSLVGEYLIFSMIDDSDVNEEILAEKLCDYFEILDAKNKKIGFKHYLSNYIEFLNNIISDKIVKPKKYNKNESGDLIQLRARKYYLKARDSVKNIEGLNVRILIDYTRVMICLYNSILNNSGDKIINFDYSSSGLEPDKIIRYLRAYQNVLSSPIKKKDILTTKGLHSSEVFSIIIASILLYNIVDERVEGEYYHE